MQHASSSNTVPPNNVANFDSSRKGESKNKKVPKKLRHIPYSCLDNDFTRLRPSPTTLTEGNPLAPLSKPSNLNFDSSYKNAEEELQGVALRQEAQGSSLVLSQNYDGDYILPSAYDEHNSLSYHYDEGFLSSYHYDQDFLSSSHNDDHYPSSSHYGECYPSSSHYDERYPSSSHYDERYPSSSYSDNNYLSSSHHDHAPPFSQYRVENYPAIQDNSQTSYVCSLAYALGPPGNSRS